MLAFLFCLIAMHCTGPLISTQLQVSIKCERSKVSGFEAVELADPGHIGAGEKLLVKCTRLQICCHQTWTSTNLFSRAGHKGTPREAEAGGSEVQGHPWLLMV